jgi:hypothetical protein
VDHLLADPDNPRTLGFRHLVTSHSQGVVRGQGYNDRPIVVAEQEPPGGEGGHGSGWGNWKWYEQGHGVRVGGGVGKGVGEGVGELVVVGVWEGVGSAVTMEVNRTARCEEGHGRAAGLE